MLRLARKLSHVRQSLLPEGYVFDRPLVLLQSDDWGRVGVQDRDGWHELEVAGITLGKRPYDYYSLETARDVAALRELLNSHRDSMGRPACMVMNFITANLDFERLGDRPRQPLFRRLVNGLPGTWCRPGLFTEYRAGVQDGVFYPALHGLCHFCQPAVERMLSQATPEADLLRTLWRAQTPFIHWRMPWIGYEFRESQLVGKDRFLPFDQQMALIVAAREAFTAFFETRPLSACAPGFCSSSDTHRAWHEQGILVAQHGWGLPYVPHFDEFGLLHLCRGLEFEPALHDDLGFAVEPLLQRAVKLLDAEFPLIISIHSINFHSSLKNFREPTLRYLHELLLALEARYPNLLYVHDGDMHQIVTTGVYESVYGRTRIGVTKRTFLRWEIANLAKNIAAGVAG